MQVRWELQSENNNNNNNKIKYRLKYERLVFVILLGGSFTRPSQSWRFCSESNHILSISYESFYHLIRTELKRYMESDFSNFVHTNRTLQLQ